MNFANGKTRKLFFPVPSLTSTTVYPHRHRSFESPRPSAPRRTRHARPSHRDAGEREREKREHAREMPGLLALHLLVRLHQRT